VNVPLLLHHRRRVAPLIHIHCDERDRRSRRRRFLSGSSLHFGVALRDRPARRSR
jgi:hypothetical protein